MSCVRNKEDAALAASEGQMKEGERQAFSKAAPGGDVSEDFNPSI
jgi:hypothetical protein